MRYPEGLKTTLNVDDDVLQVAKQRAAQRGKSVQQGHSGQAQQILKAKGRPRVRNGVPLFQPRTGGATKPSMALVNQLR